MGVTTKNWKNKGGTGERSCCCGSWKEHWINETNKSWPVQCSVEGCNNKATLGAHVINSTVSGEYIIPACDSCNKLEKEFDLKVGISLARANQSLTCKKK